MKPKHFFINLLFFFPFSTINAQDLDVSLAAIETPYSTNIAEEIHEEKYQEPEQNSLHLFSDFRFRPEQDWSSRNFDGTFREDRFRLRVRFRVGFIYNWNEQINFGARIRTGVNESLQSPHNNFGHREFTGYPINFDQVYISGKHGKIWWWAGKNDFPFWKQNELFWDDDVTPEGIATGATLSAKNLTIRPKLAYFITSTGNGDFDPRDPTNGDIDGHILGAQLEMGLKLGEHNLTLASSYLSMKDINNVPTTDFFYEGDRFKLDYSFLVSGAKFDIDYKIPISLGADYFVNFEDYSQFPDELIDPIYKDQKTGFVLSAQVGKLKHKDDWLIGYFYTRKEELSVVSYYTEDDWIRLGNINRNRNTNFKGHEFRFAYALDARFNIMARVYLVEGLVTPDVATESGNRFRIDFNIKFDKQVL